jgi:hypothetical protein
MKNGNKSHCNGHKNPVSEPHKPHKQRREPTDLQKAFGLAYIEGESKGKANGTQAARDAGYRGSKDTLGRIAHDNLKSPQVQELIKRIRKQVGAATAVTRTGRILASSKTLALHQTAGNHGESFRHSCRPDLPRSGLCETFFIIFT